MRLAEYQQRLHRLSESGSVRLKYDSYADAMPAWIPILEKIAKDIVRVMEKRMYGKRLLPVQYWVARESIKRSRPMIHYALVGDVNGIDNFVQMESELAKIMRKFQRSARNICAICAAKVSDAQESGEIELRCPSHRYIVTEDVCDELWDELFDNGDRVNEARMRIMQASLARWDSFKYLPHKTSPRWYERYATSIDVNTKKYSAERSSSPKLIGELELRSMVRRMGALSLERTALRWLADVASRPRKAYEQGVDSFMSLAAVLAIALQEHGSHQFIATCLDMFLALNDLEIRANADSMQSALDSLADGRWMASDFACWLNDHTERRIEAHVSVPVCKSNIQPEALVQ